MKLERRIELTTDHFQLLFGDSVRSPLVDTTTLWDKPGRVVSLAGFPELVGLGTVRYGGVTRLTVRVVDQEEEAQTDWQLLGRFDVSVPSGRMIFWGPEIQSIREAVSLQLSPGCYRGKAFCRGAEAVVDEMAADGPDEYLIALWKNPD